VDSRVGHLLVAARAAEGEAAVASLDVVAALALGAVMSARGALIDICR